MKRMLIGIRWWMEFENNEEKYVFECKIKEEETPNKFNERFFWLSQIAMFVIWAIFFVLKLIKFKFQMVII